MLFELILISQVPVSDTVEVDEAHIVPFYYTHPLTVFHDLAVEEVLSLHFVRSHLDVACITVFLVFNFKLSD